MAEVKVAVVGTGGIARRHGLALAENPDAMIAAAVDVDRQRREEFAARWGGEPLDRLSPALDRVDAVYVLTPPGFRRQYALEAIAAGKHVLCEKPLAITVEDGAAIVEAAENQGVVAMTGFNQRFRDGYRRLHDTARGGSLGRLHHFWWLSSGASAVINASWSSRIGCNSRGVLGLRGAAFVSGTALGNNGIWCSREFHRKTDE